MVDINVNEDENYWSLRNENLKTLIIMTKFDLLGK